MIQAGCWSRTACYIYRRKAKLAVATLPYLKILKCEKALQSTKYLMNTAQRHLHSTMDAKAVRDVQEPVGRTLDLPEQTNTLKTLSRVLR